MKRFRHFIERKLKRELLGAGFLALAISIGAIIGVFFLTNEILEKTIYGTYFMGYMAEREMDSLTSWMRKMSIDPDHLQDLQDWAYDHYRSDVYFYQDDEMLGHVSFWKNDDSGSGEELEETMHGDGSYYERLYERNIQLTDDSGQTETVTVRLYYHPSHVFYYLSFVLSAVSGFAIFAVVLILFVRKKLRYIVQVKKELDILAGGNLEYQLTETGEDELFDLVQGINLMRLSILEKQAAEETARASNAQLVTAMSHDLRSPLTGMIGYLEVLKRHKYTDEKQRDYLLESSYNKAIQIKQMSDQLFEYFLVSDDSGRDLDLEEYDAAILVLGLLEEYIFSLEMEGFQIQNDLPEIKGTLQADPEILKRVFDNLYSNLKKYAQPECVITLTGSISKQTLTLTMTNPVRQDICRAESTGIGLKSCERIMAMHQGSFHWTKTKDLFEVQLVFALTE